MVSRLTQPGFVLAVLPLVISALEHYNEGAKPLKDFVRYKQMIRELVVDLSTQKALFRNTLEKLLSNSVTSDVRLALLLEHPGGEGWQDDELASDLRRRLQGSYDVYMASVNDMEGLVKSLQESMGLDKQGKVPSRPKPRKARADSGSDSLNGLMQGDTKKLGRSSSCVFPEKIMRRYYLGWIGTTEISRILQKTV